MIKPYRKRYLLFQTLTLEGKIRGGDIKDVIFDNFKELFGITGLSQADLTFINYDEEKGLGVLRCSHKLLDNVRASIAFIQKADGKNVSLNVLRVSGTIKKLRKLMSETKNR